MFRKLANRTAFLAMVASAALVVVASPTSAAADACLYDNPFWAAQSGGVICTNYNNRSYHDDSGNDRFNNGVLIADRVSAVDLTYGDKLRLWTDHHYSGLHLDLIGSNDGDIEAPHLGGYDNVFSSHYFFY